MAPDSPRKVEIPRWVQLVGLPLILVGAWQLVAAVSHAVFIFVVAALIAILLNPIVRAFAVLRLPRPVAVLVVYALFAVVFIGAGVIAGTVVATQVQAATSVVQEEFTKQPGQTETPAQKRLDRLQTWLDRHHLEQIDVRDLSDKVQAKIDSLDVQSVRPGNPGRRRRESVQRRAGDRRLGLHAAGRAPAVEVSAPPVPARRDRRRPDHPLRAGADRLCARADDGLAGDRHHRGSADVAARHHRRLP
ncbi:MAG: AI-2E family transporter [Chloroflexi bacterium]|nr:MAG: AI-2E family transporter [Chloroflexota bacterium]